MTRKMSVTVQVSHDGNEFQYLYSGDVLDDGGTIEVTGTKGTPVKIEFTAKNGKDVDEVSFLEDAKKSIRIGPKDVRTCPPDLPNDEFDDEQHGNSKKVLTVKDKANNNGKFQYALFFRAQRMGGQPEVVSSDPMIINNFN